MHTSSWVALGAIVWMCCTWMVYDVLGTKDKVGLKPVDSMFKRWEHYKHINVVKRTAGWLMIILSPLTVMATIITLVALLLMVVAIGAVKCVNAHISS